MLIFFFLVEIIPSTFSNYCGIKLEISNRRKTGESINMWKFNDTETANPLNKKSPGKSENTLRGTKTETQTS